MDERIAGQQNPRDTGKALSGPLLGTYWRDRVGDFLIICGIRDGVLRILLIELGDRKAVCR